MHRISTMPDRAAIAISFIASCHLDTSKRSVSCQTPGPTPKAKETLESRLYLHELELGRNAASGTAFPVVNIS